MKNHIVIFLILFVCINSIFGQQRKPIKQNKPRRKIAAVQNEKKIITKAINLIKANKLDEAEALVAIQIERNPLKNWPKSMYALIELKSNNLDAAKNLCFDVLKRNQKSVLAHLVLAGLARKKGKDLAAADQLRKAIKYADRPYEKEIIQYFIKDFKISEKPEIKIKKTRISDMELPESSDLPYIAVFSFEYDNADEKSNNLGNSISEMMVTAMIQTNRFKVIERTQLDKIMEEQALGQSGALDEQTALDVGNILGVNAIVVGSVSSIKTTIEMDVRLLNAQNGEAITASSGSASHESQIREAVNRMAKEIAAKADKIEIIKKADSLKVIK